MGGLVFPQNHEKRENFQPSPPKSKRKIFPFLKPNLNLKKNINLANKKQYAKKIKYITTKQINGRV